jgi:aldose 1-epimerase
LTRLVLASGETRVEILPGLGGGIARFDWRGREVFRAAPEKPRSPLELGSFVLVPFCGRIAEGRFSYRGQDVALPANFPGRPDYPHAIHGFGWQAAWTVTALTPARAVLTYRHDADAWPWAFEAVQDITAYADGYAHLLSITNHGETAMPAGFGLHPYFHRDPDAVYRGLHRGEWGSEGGFLSEPQERGRPRDFWGGAAAGTRAVDTAYEGREGAMTITWPGRGVHLAIEPDAIFGNTVVYVPPGEAFFCVEPVSHVPGALNRDGAEVASLAPGETLQAGVRFRVAAL